MMQRPESDISWTLGLGLPWLLIVMAFAMWMWPKDPPDFVTWLIFAFVVMTPIIALGVWEIRSIK